MLGLRPTPQEQVMSIYRWSMGILVGGTVLAAGAAAQSRGEQLYAGASERQRTTGLVDERVDERDERW